MHANGQGFRWTVKKGKFLRRKAPCPQTKNDETGNALHDMVEINSLKIVRMMICQYQIYEVVSAVAGGSSCQCQSLNGTEGATHFSVASSRLGRGSRRFHNDWRNFTRIRCHARPTLWRGLFCGPLITGVTREVNFRDGGLFCDLLLPR